MKEAVIDEHFVHSPQPAKRNTREELRALWSLTTLIESTMFVELPV